MMAARRFAVLLALGPQVLEVDRAVVEGRDHHDPHAGHHGGRRVRAVRARRDQAHVALGLAARLVVGPDGQQSGQLALAPGVGLDRDLGVAREVGQPPLEVVDQRQVARRAVQRGERVDVGEPGQAHRLHLGGGVELHGARAQRDHAAVEGEVPVRQPAQVAQHGRLGVVLREHGVAQDGPPAQERLGQRRRRRRPPPRHLPRAEGARGPTATWAAVVVSPHEMPTRSSSTRRSSTPSRRARRRRSLPHVRVHARRGCRRTPRARARIRPAAAPTPARPSGVHPAGDVAQALGPVVHGVHRGHHGQQHLRRADVRGGLLPADVLLARLERQPVGGAVLGVDATTRPDGPAGRARARP